MNSELRIHTNRSWYLVKKHCAHSFFFANRDAIVLNPIESNILCIFSGSLVART